MQTWQYVWRNGFAPFLPAAGLEALAEALASDRPELMQNGTTFPPPLEALKDWPVEKACPLSYGLWKGHGLATVGEVEEAFARACFEADNRLGEPAAVRYFLNHVDEADRGTMRRELLAEVRAELARRQVPAAA